MTVHRVFVEKQIEQQRDEAESDGDVEPVQVVVPPCGEGGQQGKDGDRQQQGGKGQNGPERRMHGFCGERSLVRRLGLDGRLLLARAAMPSAPGRDLRGRVLGPLQGECSGVGHQHQNHRCDHQAIRASAWNFMRHDAPLRLPCQRIHSMRTAPPLAGAANRASALSNLHASGCERHGASPPVLVRHRTARCPLTQWSNPNI